MLKLYYGMLEDKNVVLNPDNYFMDNTDLHCIDTDFGHRVLKDCVDVVKVHNYVTLELGNGELISPKDIGSGVKNLFIMKEDDTAICNLLWCGENCEKYISEIAETKDLVVCTWRPFFPDFDTMFKSGIEILNSGKVVHNGMDYLKEILEYPIGGNYGR